MCCVTPRGAIFQPIICLECLQNHSRTHQGTGPRMGKTMLHTTLPLTGFQNDMSPSGNVTGNYRCQQRTLDAAPDSFPLLPHLPIIHFSPPARPQAVRSPAAPRYRLGAGHLDSHVTCVLFFNEGWGGGYIGAPQQLPATDIVGTLSIPLYPFPFLFIFPLSSSPPCLFPPSPHPFPSLPSSPPFSPSPFPSSPLLLSPLFSSPPSPLFLLLLSLCLMVIHSTDRAMPTGLHGTHFWAHMSMASPLTDSLTLFLSVLETERRALCMPGKDSVTDPL